MKKIITFLIAFYSITNCYGQRCLSMELWENQKQINPTIDLIRQSDQLRLSLQADDIGDDSTIHQPKDYTVTIRVVFHILYNEGMAIGRCSPNISKSLVEEQIQLLNDAYSGAMKPAKNGVKGAFNTPFRFCLAKENPSGKPTNGIVRIKHNRGAFDGNNIAATDNTVKTMSPPWNPQKYLNIYVIELNDKNLMGWSSFPYYTRIYEPSGIKDGVVANYRYVGNRQEDKNNCSLLLTGLKYQVDNGRTIIHEVGHWLGLWHTNAVQLYDNGSPQASPCSEINDPRICILLGDQVCDTPPNDKLTFGKLQCDSALVCDSYSRRAVITAQNFMNYHDVDNCLREFTLGQASRMDWIVDTYRPQLKQGGGGRTECTPCTTCKPITPKIIGNDIACDGEIVTYKLDAAEPYGCDVFWQVRGGTFIDYNGALGITIPYGTNLFIDSIRVKWNSIGAVHELLAVANRCDNVDAQSLGTIATKTVTIRPFKPLTFKNPTVLVPCGSTRIFTEVIAPGTTYFEWLLPPNMRLLNAMQGYTNRTDKPEALIETPIGLGGTIKVRPLGGQCGESWVSQPIELTPAAPPVVTGIPPIFCQSGDVAWVEASGSTGDYVWEMPAGFENLGDANGNTKANKIQIKMTSNTRQGSIPMRVSEKTSNCGISEPAVLFIWVGKPAGNGQIRLASGSTGCDRIQTYEFLLNDSGNLPDGWSMAWDLTSEHGVVGLGIGYVFNVIQILGNKITIEINTPDKIGILSAKVKNICGETTYQTGIFRGKCTYEEPTDSIAPPPPSPPDTLLPPPSGGGNAANMRVIQQSVLKNAAKAFDNSTKTDFAAWADKTVFYTGETLLTHCLTTNPTAKPIAYLLAENGNLASPIDTLQLVSEFALNYMQIKIPIYSGLASGNYTLKVCVGKTCVAYMITLINHLLPKTSNAGKVVEKESAITTIAVPQKFTVEQNMPNPFDEYTTLRYFLPQKNTLKVSIYNLLGVEVYSQTVENTEGWQEFVLLTAKWHTGLYICKFEYNGEVQTKKMMLVR